MAIRRTVFALAATAGVLLLGHVMLPTSASAQFATKDRDYQVVTGLVQQSGDAVYIADNRTGLLAVFTYDINTKSLRARSVRPLNDVLTPR